MLLLTTKAGALRRTGRLLIAGCATAIAMLAPAPLARAITPTISEFSGGLNAGSSPSLGIAEGADGNMWFTDTGTTRAIGRITPAGAITEFSAGLNAGSNPDEIVAGPDGNLWFADQGTTSAIGRITPAGAITEFSVGLNAGSKPFWIAAGPDGNLWFTDEGTTKAIGRINPTTHAISEFSAGLNAGSLPAAIVAGADGNLWFADQGTTSAIGRINPSTHAINEFSAGMNPGNNPYGIAAGADGNLWFSDSVCGGGAAIGRVTPAGAISEFSAGLNAGSCPYFIATGSDGSSWFTDEGTPSAAIGRITPAASISEFSSGLNAGTTPYGIAGGPDGNVWFTDGGTPAAIGRITTPPTAVTASATATGEKSAAVSGTANGHAQATSFHVEFAPGGGTTTTTPEQSLGITSGDAPVSASLTGLAPGTSYQARVVVTNPTGTTAGAFVPFETPPDTKITKAKISPAKHQAKFRFKALGQASGFQCELKKPKRKHHKRPKARFSSCTSPKMYKHLRPGRYTFAVRAVNSAGPDPTPATRKFRI